MTYRQVVPRPADWEPGPGAAWDRPGLPTRLDADAVRQRISGRRGRPAPLAAPGARESAVLVTLVTGATDPGDTSLLLTRRSWNLRQHRGEVSFPGGGRELEDRTLVETALREAAEEVALDPGVVEIVGELDHLTTVSSDRFIVPVVGMVRAEDISALRPQPGEVDEILVVSASELLAHGAHHSEVWRREIGGRTIEHPLEFFDRPPDVIWGATAAMISQLFDLVIAGIDG